MRQKISDFCTKKGDFQISEFNFRKEEKKNKQIIITWNQLSTVIIFEQIISKIKTQFTTVLIQRSSDDKNE